MNGDYKILAMTSSEPIKTLCPPKVIARISLCGAITVNITDDMYWDPPTPEQIKNLKETFNIDVRLVKDNKNG